MVGRKVKAIDWLLVSVILVLAIIAAVWLWQEGRYIAPVAVLMVAISFAVRRIFGMRLPR